MTVRECGGCAGLGAHRRWCSVVVGPRAALLGPLGEQADALADVVGSNSAEAANLLYGAAAVLRDAARDAATEHQRAVHDT